MKKPLLLLVDDDRAVLEALEAELAPVFGDITRIESFDDPRRVLEALPTWTEERRPIAVGILDQRMPGLGGHELLVALRLAASETESLDAAPNAPLHPARTMQAAILTGYAGLEDALRVKNDSDAALYLEKPWRKEDLATGVARLLVTHLRATGAGRHLLWRELEDEADLVRHMQLRYEVYSGTFNGIQSLLPTGTLGLDVDEYDPVSFHYGLFDADLERSEMVGTHRHVPTPPNPPRAVVRDLCDRRELGAWADRPRMHPLPMLKYVQNHAPILELVEAAQAHAERVVEPTRATIADGPWQGIWNTKLFLHLAESTAAQGYYYRGDALAVMSCTRSHAVAYRRMLGWRDVPGIMPEDIGLGSLSGGTWSIIHGRRENLPAAVQQRCESASARIARTGEACRCAAFPACLGGPYETGEFSGVDVFCPVRAKEVLRPR